MAETQTAQRPQTAPASAPASKPAKRKETKRQVLQRLSNTRVSKAIAAILNCRNLKNYEMTDDEGNKIVAALSEAVTAVRNTYAAKGSVKPAGFQL